MDKGAAWVSLIPTFGIYFTMGVLQFASGLIRKAMLQNAGNSGAHYITWISSIYSGSYNLLGPLSSLMIYKIGCRKTVLIGGTLETLGLIGSFFVKDIRFFLLTYSFLSGMGAGISYPPVGVLLGYNFDRYLPLASGIAVSGVGFGFIVMPFITHSLLNRYGLQGTFLVMAGLTLQKLVFGALMRPSPTELDQLKKFGKSEKAIPTYEDVVRVSSQIQVGKEPRNNMADLCITADDAAENHAEKRDDKMAAIYDRSEKEKTSRCRTDQNRTADGDCSLKSRPGEIAMADTFSQKNSTINYNSNDSAKLTEDSKYDYTHTVLQNTTTTVPPTDPSPGSSNSSLPLTQSAPAVPHDTTSRHNPYINVVKNTRFLHFLFCTFCFTVSETLIYLVTPTYFASNGSTESEISFLLSILGICSSLVRPLMGFLASSQTADIAILFSAPFGVLGVFTFTLPFMVHIFAGRVCFIVAFGIYQCSIYSLLNKMLVQICGLDNLSAAFGFMMLAKGIATIFGPPITVAVLHSTDSVFLVAGFMYEVCSLAALFLSRGNTSAETGPECLQLEER